MLYAPEPHPPVPWYSQLTFMMMNATPSRTPQKERMMLFSSRPSPSLISISHTFGNMHFRQTLLLTKLHKKLHRVRDHGSWESWGTCVHTLDPRQQCKWIFSFPYTLFNGEEGEGMTRGRRKGERARRGDLYPSFFILPSPTHIEGRRYRGRCAREREREEVNVQKRPRSSSDVVHTRRA